MNAPSTKKRVIGIALITAVAILGDAMLLIVLPLYWHEFGLTAMWQIGLLLSINRFIRLPITPLVGMFYQRFQLRTGVFIALLLAIFTTFSYGFIQAFWLLLLMRVLWGVAWSLLRLGGLLTVMDTTSDHHRGNFIGLYNGLWGLGGLVGMFAGGLLVDQTSILFVTTSFAVLGLLALPAVFSFVPVTKGANKETAVKREIENGWLTPYVALVLVTGLVMGFIVFGVFASTLSPLIEGVYHQEWTIARLTVGAATLAGLLQAVRWGWDPFIAPVIGRLVDAAKTSQRVLLLPLFGGGLLFFILGSVSPISLLLVSLLLFQLLSTIFVTTTDTLATNVAARSNRVKVITAHTIVTDVGAALGPLFAFFVIDIYKVSTVYYFSGTLLIALGAGWLIFMKRTAFFADS
ncbi:Predicted arabinose efflux permease, MFS family [Evansella caseinilytica]|uniref:Predicted arabinose efflux permease, MFS family n=1 Tax=Evansella caseinilytica TaxID=1503961 RepID=A0A1H3U957_9BACI|nr:MFS transporter [Evansella caseinilytica]SDZ58621.1 Predicted arabinose efflux permease, MFS family [Evansella caseinilytica]